MQFRFKSRIEWVVRCSVATMLALHTAHAAGQQPGEVLAVVDESVEEKVEPFIRLQRDEQGHPTALQIATARYVSQNGAGPVSVDLIGAVHIGDKEYYESLNKQFSEYEVVLYELVAERGTRVPKGGGERNGNPLTMIHSMAQSVLGLASQLEHVDYTKDNFVHADMTPGEMAAAMRERGDTPLTFALSAFTEAMRAQNRRAAAAQKEGAEGADGAQPDPLAEIDMMSMLTDKNAGAKLKITMAEQFGATGSLDNALGATMNQAIVVDRNKAALKVFQKQLVTGRRKMAIFYGAAPLPDFEKRLKEDFGMQRTQTTWTTAWDLTKEGPKQTASPLNTLFRLLNN